jgi:molybdopterin-containing oxidoreductase family iron-sulfur binding subunit
MPVRNAIPYFNYPDNIKAGVAAYYASTFFDGMEYCAVLVKTRDGRPIKIEGNESSAITKGGTSARVQASVLSLYDTARVKSPLKGSAATDWATIDKEIGAALAQSSADKKVVILTGSELSPSTKALYASFIAKYPNTEIVSYDAISMAGSRLANARSFGIDAIPSYAFDKAHVVVSFAADFLGTWLSPIEFSKQWAKGRKVSEVKAAMSKLFVLEANLSLTGSNADKRYLVKPSEEKSTLLALYNEVAAATGNTGFQPMTSTADVKLIAKELVDAKGKSLVISGSNDTDTQIIVNAINVLLGNYGTTIDLGTAVNYRQGNDAAVKALVDEMKAGKVGTLLINGVNPVYDLSPALGFKEALSKVVVSATFTESENETSLSTTYTLATSHYLESWNDAEPKLNSYSLAQPTIGLLFDTRQFQDCLLKWAGIEGGYYAYIKQHWTTELFGKQSKYLTASDFWNFTLQEGVFELPASGSFTMPALSTEAISTAAGKTKGGVTDGLELILYPKVGIGNGRDANNPWLQELPDPITKATWDNYVTVSKSYAEENNLKVGDFVKVGDAFELPVIVQPGQASGTVGLALGYGRTKAGSVAENVGQNGYSLVSFANDSFVYHAQGITLKATGRNERLGLTQEWSDMEGREIIRETTLGEYLEDSKSGNEFHFKVAEESTTLYPTPKFADHHWGLAIDMNSCTGCSACVIACQAENNVAVIGKLEVSHRRIMHWIRLDRYYEGDPENPTVLQQPVMCQHCDNAPCENVCPVAATPHSSEGLNQMVYNRCIGTRYCMNNCPYRVRRFNWFEYTKEERFDFNMSNDLGRMQLNPDVVVRSRGVVEKCSLCVQRIQDHKLTAKMENRELRDGEIKTACMQSCASDAIQFGDLNDKESKVFRWMTDDRNYQLLEELHTLPSVGYLTKVRNTEKGEKSANEHHA